MPRKEKTNAKTWERERRSRMNLYFKGLADLLPPHQDGKNRNKVDILIQASKYIKDLTNRTEELFYAHAVDAHKEELNRLKKLVAQLYSRTQLLSTLLKDAGITVPAEPALEKISPLKWSNKINVEDAEKYLDRLKERKTERRKSKSIAIKMPSKKKMKNGTVSTSTKKSVIDKASTDSINNGPAEDQENHVNSSISNKNGEDKGANTNNKADAKTNSISGADKETFNSAGPNLRGGVRKTQSRKRMKRKRTRSHDDAPSLKEVLSKVTKFQPHHATQSQSIASLIPGTLILSGVSKIMPLVTPMTSNIIVNGSTQSGNPIMLGNAPANPMIVMQPLVNRIQNTTVVSVPNEVATMNVATAATVTSVQKVTLNTVPSIQTNVRLDSYDWASNVKTIIDATKIGGRVGILPKGKEITKTTMAYKVPIPAVHRDGKTNNRNIENTTEAKKAIDVKNKIKKMKPMKNKKLAGIKNSDEDSTKSRNMSKSDEAVGCDVRTITDSCGKKRKNVDSEGVDSETPPTKINKNDLPETCESIESLRHVVEKIGDCSTAASAVVTIEQLKDSDDNKCKVGSINSDSKSESAELVAPQNKIDEFISNSVKINSIEIQDSLPEKIGGTTDTLSDMKNICASMNTLSKSCQVSDASFTNQNQLTNAKSIDLLIPSSSTTITTLSSETPLSAHLPVVERVINETQENVKEMKEVTNIKTGYDLISNQSTHDVTLEPPTSVDNTKIILNLDTNTTTTMKPERNLIASSSSNGITEVTSKSNEKDKVPAPRTSLSYSVENSFIPIGSRTEALHSDLSNDLFASLQVPSSSHNPESISPTAAFLMAFPLVSSLNGKTEVLEEDMKEDLKYHSQTPPMLLQIGAIEPNSFKVKQSTDNDETRCLTEKDSKTESCRTASVKINSEVPSKALPKIVNTETFKDRLYKIIPYTCPSKKLPESPLSCSSTVPTSASNVCNNREEKIVTKPSSELCMTQGKHDNPPSSSISESPVLTSISNEITKYNANIRYPSLPDYLPSYSTFAVSSGENQMLPSTNSTVPSYSAAQIPLSQTCLVSSGIKDVPQTLRHADFMNVSSRSSKENNSIGSVQTTMTADYQKYQPRTSDGESSIVQPLPPPPLSSSSSSSSQSLQYNYSSRPKDMCSIQTQRNNHTIYPDHHNKNDQLCSMSTESVNNSGSYPIHGKDSVNQMPYQAFSIVQKDRDSNTNDTISNQLMRTSSSSCIPPRIVDSLTTNFTENKVVDQNYQSYLPFEQNKDSSLPTTQQQQQGNNDVQVPNLGQSYPTQVKQIQSNDSFDNVQQHQRQHHDYAPAGKHDTFVSTNSTDQRIKLLPDNMNKSQSQQDNNSQQQIETLYQTKRDDSQSNIPYSRDQKKVFNVNASNNPQVPQSHVLNTTLSQYQVQQRQQQSCVSTTNYNQRNAAGNMAKTTTTVANNSSNFSILSWTTFSPIYGSSSININSTNNSTNNNNTNNINNTNTNNDNNNNSNNNNNGNNTNNNDNDNIIQFEAVSEHVDDTQGQKICENYNFNTLHKDNIGYVNLMVSDTTFTGANVTTNGSNGDKVKNKLNHKQETTYNNVTSDKVKNSVQSLLSPHQQHQHQQQQQQQQQKPGRSLNQNQNVNDNFKFSGNQHNNNNSNNTNSNGNSSSSNNDEKNKSKFPMDSAYTQTEFATVDQHSRHQHTSKSHQNVTSKVGKSASYAIAGFDPQVPFDVPDEVPPSKCTADIYPGNFKFPGNKEHHPQNKYQSIAQNQPALIQQNNAPYNTAKQNLPQQQNNNSNNNNKIKPVIHQQTVRPPVNWMMTPEIKHNSNITDIILPPIGKELEFCPNNIFSQTPSYNQTSNQFYNNYDATVSSSHTFPNVASLQTDSRRIIDSFYTDDQQFSWSPTKNPPGTETMKTIDQQVVVPSTLPTLVGDLALGTNIPEKQNFLYNQLPSRSNTDLTKSTIKEKDTNITSRDFQVMLNSQTVQHASQSGSFLSVSQLVEHEKEKTNHHHQQTQHTHHHTQQQPPQTQTRKPQRKAGNTSPRGGAKRQIDIRKQTGDQQLQQQQTQSQVQQQHADDQKVPSTHGFTDQTYQQSQQQSIKYQQNDSLWRNRNCKSNYTAEALIGANHTTVQDTNNTDKQLHTPTIKFPTDFPQNKFPTSLSTSDMVIPPINYLSNPDDGNSYGQIMNQNFNHSSYTYSANSNIYPSTNFMTGIPNTPSAYPMMTLHDNPTDYLETNSFLLPSVGNITSSSKSAATITSSVTTRNSSTAVTVPTNVKTHQQYSNNNVGKHQNCTDKRNSYSTVSKKNKRKTDSTMNNLDISISGVSAPIEDYHPHASSHHHHHHHHHTAPPHPPPPHHHHHHHHGHSTSFLATSHTNTLYQNHPHTPSTSVGVPMNGNRTRGSNAASSHSVAMAHHPSGTSLTNFNLSTIFPEINDKVTGYKPSNPVAPGLSQLSNHSINYPQRANYTTNNTLGHMPQITETTQFTTNLPPPPASVLHYKGT